MTVPTGLAALGVALTGADLALDDLLATITPDATVADVAVQLTATHGVDQGRLIALAANAVHRLLQARRRPVWLPGGEQLGLPEDMPTAAQLAGGALR